MGSQVRLDARTKLLNPKWYEGMLSSGYEGVREIQKRLTNTVGWSATSGQVDNWVYDEVSILPRNMASSLSLFAAPRCFASQMLDDAQYSFLRVRYATVL